MTKLTKEDLLDLNSDTLDIVGLLVDLAERHGERLDILEDLTRAAQQGSVVTIINAAPKRGKLLIFAALVASAVAGGVVGYKFYEYKVTDEGYLRWKAGQSKTEPTDA